MAGWKQRWSALQILVIFSLLNIATEFEVREDEWEELRSDIAALHRFRGLSERMSHEDLSRMENLRIISSRMRNLRIMSRLDLDLDKNLLDLLDLQTCSISIDCVISMRQALDAVLAHIQKQKMDSWLKTASEISHSYSQKLLVMTDHESSTSDRVLHEYSMDPHYSEIVSVACLHNQSCVPEADSYTVVKIFGSASEDGWTVSGLSGFSLANLLLQTPLKSAALFSLDGNTTTHFQHSFIRVFMLHGLRSVLETNQENHQIYQVMDQPDSISKYQIPQRPIDHSTQYDHQQIVMLQDNEEVRSAAKNLYEKHPAVSSMYVLDENQKPKLIGGEDVPLSENSRLVLLGHGAPDDLGKMRVAKYTAEDLVRIIQSTSRVGDKIKTTSVVACNVGSDKAFVETMVKGLHGTGIKTELHLKNAEVQVLNTGKKVTLEVSPGQKHWIHKDTSKKVVATMDKNGEVIIRNEPGSKGREVFINERNYLGKPDKKIPPKGKKDQTQDSRSSWPEEPRRFIDPEVYKKFDKTKAENIKHACDELESLTWGIFHPEHEPHKRVQVDLETQRYLLGERQGNNMKWINEEAKLRQVLQNCYEIQSGEDVKNIIRHYVKSGEDKLTYLMIKDWIFSVDPKSLYIYPVGKKLNNNDNVEERRKFITAQSREGRESYSSIRNNIDRRERVNYAKYVTEILHGTKKYNPRSELGFYFTWYFTASVIAESVRNFRTFPLVLMALEMSQRFDDNNVREKGLNFLFEEHSMARGGSWIDPTKRGFFGAAAPPESSRSKDNAMTSLKEVIGLEADMFRRWEKSLEEGKTLDAMTELAQKYRISEDTSRMKHDYLKSKEAEQDSILTTPGAEGRPSSSGALGGNHDGYVTMRDLSSATELEESFKYGSYFQGVSASLSEQIQAQLKAEHGDDLGRLHFQDGTARIEDGHFVCQLVSEGADAKAVEFRVPLSQESLSSYEKMTKNIEKAEHNMEILSSTSSHQTSKFVEHSGTAVGVLGLALGFKGAVRAFEQGDVTEGVMGTLQSAHGVTSMVTSAISTKVLSSETKIATTTAKIFRSPVFRRFATVIPVAGIGFGIWNIVEDLKRNDTLGYIDASLDGIMTFLDVVELFVPEAALVIQPINLALSIIRLPFDDIYMGVQKELESLPEDATVLDKVQAFFAGVGEGYFHFEIHMASIFYDWHYDEIEEGQKLVAQISDYHNYYTVTKEDDGTTAIDFGGGGSSWNGGGISFCLSDQGPSDLCMDYFVSSDDSPGRRCWSIDAGGSKDIYLGLGESHELEHTTYQKKVLMLLPVGSVTVVSGYKAASYSRYGSYKGNRDSNRFFAVQKAADSHTVDVMLSYYYKLYGQPGDDIFFLGPQRSYVEGSGGKDTYMIAENGGKTIINNYDASKALDTLHFSVNYSHISVQKSGDHVVLMYQGSHTVTVQNWFLGDLYRHMNMMSGDGVLFEISSTVISSVKLVARGINKRFMKHGGTVDASEPLLRTVTNIYGSQYDDIIVGNPENNVIDGGGGRDRLTGGEGEDVYVVKDRNQFSVVIENDSRDMKIDMAIIEADFHSFTVSVEGDDVHLSAPLGASSVRVTLVNWFRSSADRHLLITSKDLITFTVSDKREDCQRKRPLKGFNHPFDPFREIDSAINPFREIDSAINPFRDPFSDPFSNPFRDPFSDPFMDPFTGPFSHDYSFHLYDGPSSVPFDPFKSCIKSRSINYQNSTSALEVDLQEDDALHGVTEVRGSQFDDVIKGNNENNVLIPERGNDFLEGRGGKDWYVISPGPGVKTINNYSPDGALDVLLVRQPYQDIRCFCEGQNLVLLVPGGKIVLQNWFDSKNNQHLQMKTSDGTTAGLQTNISSCHGTLLLPLTVDYRKHTPEPLQNLQQHCYGYRTRDSVKLLCDLQGKVMNVTEEESVKEMFGSAGFDVMVGNKNGNVMDPYTGGGMMFGGEGKDTYVIKRGYGHNLLIDNFAEDEETDTVLVDMDFLDGSQVVLTSGAKDLNVTITTKEEELKLSLLGYNRGDPHQHLDFQTADGVRFKLRALNSTADVPVFQIEAFKVVLKQLQMDCRLDLSALRNLSKVQTVQGCPSQSNNILGNFQDNVFIGGWKDDILEGQGGDDTLIGGHGNDILAGGTGDDTLYGEDGDDVLLGDSGRDVFIPGPGSDLVDGGSGRDTVLYRGNHSKHEGVYVNLLSGQGHHGDAEGDVLQDVENVIGSIYSDILVSGYKSSLLKGSDGNDLLVSTGDDYLVGGQGNDIYILAFNHGSTTIDNCAEDMETDVLFLDSLSSFHCEVSSDQAVLVFFGPDETKMKVRLRGWGTAGGKCDHLVLALRNDRISVARLCRKF